MDEDSVGEAIQKSLETGKLLNYMSFIFNSGGNVTGDKYVEYLYLMTRDYINDSRFKSNIKNEIFRMFSSTEWVNFIIYTLTLEEQLFLFSVVPKTRKLVSINIILTETMLYRDSSIGVPIANLAKKIFEKQIVTIKDYIKFRIERVSNPAFMGKILRVLLPNPIQIKEILDDYKGKTNRVLDILKEYLDEVTLNQI